MTHAQAILHTLALEWVRGRLWPLALAALLLGLVLTWRAYRARRRIGDHATTTADDERLAPSAARRAAAAALRIAALLALAAIWLGPAIPQPDPRPAGDDRPDPPDLLVLLDTSASMSLADQAGRTRFERMVNPWRLGHAPDQTTGHDATTFHDILDLANVLTFAFDKRVRPVALTDPLPGPRDDAPTAMLDAVEALARRAAPSPDRPADPSPRPRPTMLLISDGHDTALDRPADPDAAVADLADRLAARGITLFAAAPPRDAEPALDYRVIATTPADAVFTDAPVEVDARIARRGDAETRSLAAELLADGRVVQTATVTFDTGQRRRTLTFRHETQPAPSPDTTSPPDRDDQPDAEPRARPRAPAAAAAVYTVRLTPPAGDRSPANNADSVVVRRMGRPMRLLLLEGEPGWPSRFLVDALRGDERVLLTSVHAVTADRTIVAVDDRDADAPVGSVAGGLTARLRERPAEVFADFDAVLLGRRVDRLVTDAGADALRDYVEADGGLWLTRADPFTGSPQASQALRAISPLAWGRRVASPMRLSLAGASDSPSPPRPATLDAALDVESLPLMTAGTLSDGPRAAAVVLMRQRPADADGNPQAEPFAALAWQRVGRGRVVVNLSEGLWRWAILPPRLDPYRAAYRGIVASLARRAALGEPFEARRGLALDASPNPADTGRPVHVALTGRFVKPAALTDGTVRLIAMPPAADPGREPDPAPAAAPDAARPATPIALDADPADPTAAVGAFTPTRAGRYELVATIEGNDGATARLPLIVRRPTGELDDPSPRPQWLAALAEATGGSIVEAGDWATIMRHLERRPSPPADAQGPEPAPTPTPAWDRLWLFAVIVAALAGEWFLRRTGGMS